MMRSAQINRSICRTMIQIRGVRHFCSTTVDVVPDKEQNSTLTTVRLSKAIASSGVCSRRDADTWIKEGRITVNYERVRSIGKLVTKDDKICVDGVELKKHVNYEKPKLWMVYKLPGELVAASDPAKKRPVVFERLRHLKIHTENLKPINRLEFGMEGLLLVTNSARLASAMQSPLAQLERKYRLRVHGKVTPSKLDGLQRGLHVNGTKYKPIMPTITRTTGTVTWMVVTTTDNKQKMLKNCFKSMYLDVTRAISVGFGPYKLEKMTPGDVKEVPLTQELLRLYLKGKESSKVS